MSQENIIGNKSGVALWNMMSASEDEFEKQYFKRINAAATKFGKVWFTDTVTQRETRKNQTVWQMTWLSSKSVWEVTRFHVPSEAKEVTDRIIDYLYPKEQVIELTAADIISR